MNVAERRDEGCEVVVVGYRVLHDINKLSRVRVAKTADARATTIVKYVGVEERCDDITGGCAL